MRLGTEPLHGSVGGSLERSQEASGNRRGDPSSVITAPISSRKDAAVPGAT